MLSAQQCRKILGTGCSLTDSEMETLRDQLYCLAEVALTALPDQLLANRIPGNWSQISAGGVN